MIIKWIREYPGPHGRQEKRIYSGDAYNARAIVDVRCGWLSVSLSLPVPPPLNQQIILYLFSVTVIVVSHTWRAVTATIIVRFGVFGFSFFSSDTRLRAAAPARPPTPNVTGTAGSHRATAHATRRITHCTAVFSPSRVLRSPRLIFDRGNSHSPPPSPFVSYSDVRALQ